MITKLELEEAGWYPFYDDTRTRWTLDGDETLFNVKTQTLFHASEINEATELCKVTSIEDLTELVYAIFKIEREDEQI